MKKYFFYTSVLLLILNTNSAEANKVNQAIFAVKSGLVSHLLAKELCSCVYVTGIFERLLPEFGSEEKAKKEALHRCLIRASLPVPQTILDIIESSSAAEKDAIIVDPTLIADILTGTNLPTAVAIYHREAPQFGCSLVFREK